MVDFALNLILERVGNFIVSQDSDRQILQKEKEQLMQKLKIIRSNKEEALMREAAKALAAEVFSEQVHLIHQENTFRVFTMSRVCVLKACFVVARSVTLDLHEPGQADPGRATWDQRVGFVSFRSSEEH